MNNQNNRELLVLRLKGVSYIPKVGNLGPTIERDGLNKGLAKIVLMTKVDDGAILRAVANTGEYKGKAFEAFIPNSQIEIMQFKELSETNSQAKTGNDKG